MPSLTSPSMMQTPAPAPAPAPASHLQGVPSGNAAARAMAPTAVRGKRAATRHRLMDATSALIIRDGFEAVSMTSVAEEARITRQTVYRYFPNSREVIRATLTRAGRELLDGQLLVFAEEGDPRDLLVESVMTALRLIDRNPLLRTAWSCREYPQAMLQSSIDPSYTAPAVAGLAPIAEKLGWSERDTREAYDLISRTVMSFLTIPPIPTLTEEEVRESLYRRLLPALCG